MSSNSNNWGTVLSFSSTSRTKKRKCGTSNVDAISAGTSVSSQKKRSLAARCDQDGLLTSQNWPLWAGEEATEFQTKYPWLACTNGKLGCSVCIKAK